MKTYNWLVMVAMVAITACLASCSKTREFDDPNACYNGDLLKFVPAKAEVVIAMNPQLLLKSAGCDWTDDGIKLSDFITDKIKEMPDGDKDLKKVNENLKKIKGVNHNSLVAFCDGIRNWYFVMAITDHDQLDEFLKECKVEKAQEFDGFKVWDMEKADGCFIDDKEDGILWMVATENGDDAVRAIQNLKKSAEDKALPEWGVKLLNQENSELSALVNINAFGVNLPGLMKTAGVDARLLGDDVTYVGATLAESNHKVNFNLTTYNADGKPADLLNPQIRQGADFSALNALPPQCLTGIGLAVNPATLLSWFPQMSREIGDAQAEDYIKSIRSAAMGFTAIDLAKIRYQQFPNVALTVAFSGNKAAEFFNLAAQNIQQGGMGTVNGNTIEIPMERGATPFEGSFRITVQGDIVLVTNIPGASISSGNKMPVSTDGALMASYQKPGAIAGLETAGDGYALLTPHGLESQATVASNYPGMIAAIIENAANFINQF